MLLAFFGWGVVCLVVGFVFGATIVGKAWDHETLERIQRESPCTGLLRRVK